MPLYTYVAIYKGTSYIAQQRRSNYQGFGDWIEGKRCSGITFRLMS